MKSYELTAKLNNGYRYEYLIEAENRDNAINLFSASHPQSTIESISEGEAILDIAEMIISHRILYK